MPVNSLNEGAVSPLLSIWRRSLTLAGALLLSACSHNSSLPPFTASGYADNQGAVRIWRKDSDNETHMLATFSPWRSGNTSTSEYRWQGDTLSLIELNIYGKPPEHIRVRFDDHGDLSFMQREVDGQKQQLSNDQIALYRYQAQQIRQTSDALRQGRVVLRQGRWHANHTVTTCEGQTIKPDLEALAISHIERRQSHSSVEVSVAWLEAPEGSQLLLVANEDFCTWQPKEKSF
ncbi:putative VirB-like lipoprotein [Scandinavium goeteborgense]|uniref:Putative VirB-like lipoprotein n=1 Tax=Scandinavium goeteborgense TaxID=1851514 RepID=A0A4R6DQE1_SCAGO|nr:putative VirB-like lipoprotein [Scandinavium goeteborgense]